MPRSVIVLGLMGKAIDNVAFYRDKKVGVAPPMITTEVDNGSGLGWTAQETIIRAHNDEEIHYTEIHFRNPKSLEYAIDPSRRFHAFHGPLPLRVAILGHGATGEENLGWEQDVRKHGSVHLAELAGFIAHNIDNAKSNFTEEAPLKISLLACQGAAWHKPHHATEMRLASYSMAGRLLTDLKKLDVHCVITAYWRSTVSRIQNGKQMILKFGESLPEGFWQRMNMQLFNNGIMPYSEGGVGAKLKFSMRGDVIEVRCKNSGDVVVDDEFLPIKTELCVQLIKFQLSEHRNRVVQAKTYATMLYAANDALMCVMQRAECQDPVQYAILSSLHRRLLVKEVGYEH